jgi:hypothetical protein
VWSCRLGSQNIMHIGSAHDDGGFEALRAARRRLAAAQSQASGGPRARVAVSRPDRVQQDSVLRGRPRRRRDPSPEAELPRPGRR